MVKRALSSRAGKSAWFGDSPLRDGSQIWTDDCTGLWPSFHSVIAVIYLIHICSEDVTIKATIIVAVFFYRDPRFSLPENVLGICLIAGKAEKRHTNYIHM